MSRTLEAETPDHALELIEQQSGQPALIVSDINMPGTPIEEFTQTVKARPEFAETVLLLLTGSCKETARQARSPTQKMRYRPGL